MARPVTAITDTFGLQEEDAEMLYYQLILVALGLALTCTSGKSPLTIPQVSEILGKNVRAFLMVIRAYILSHLKFSVAEQAVLLGISPTSVTKARQRLKAKMCILSQPFGMVLRYSYVTAPEKGKVEQVK